MRPLRLAIPLLLGSLAVLWALAVAASLWVTPAGPSPPPGGVNGSGQLSEAADDGPWTVLVLADVQGGFAYLPAIFERARSRDPVATIILGDLSRDHDPLHLQLPVRSLQRTPAPGALFVVPGNHDIRGEQGREPFLRWFGSTTFDFAIGRTRFLGLDNADGPLEPASLRGLEEKLRNAASRDQRVVLCLHRDVIDWEGKLSEGAEGRNRELLELVEAYPVVLVMTGHHHVPHREIRGKTWFVVAPASGDRSGDTGDSPVSFLILRWTGSSLELEDERFPRDAATDLRGTLLHVALSHLRPLREGQPTLFWGAVAISLAALVAAWRSWLGRLLR